MCNWVMLIGSIQLQEEYDKTALSTLRRAQVVGMTTSGVASRRDLVAALAPKVQRAVPHGAGHHEAPSGLMVPYGIDVVALAS